MNCGLKVWGSFCMCDNIIPGIHLGCDLIWHGERTEALTPDIRTKLIREMSLCGWGSSGRPVKDGFPQVGRWTSCLQGIFSSRREEKYLLAKVTGREWNSRSMIWCKYFIAVMHESISNLETEFKIFFYNLKWLFAASAEWPDMHMTLRLVGVFPLEDRVLWLLFPVELLFLLSQMNFPTWFSSLSGKMYL